MGRHPMVSQCAVLARTDGGQETRLVAYLVGTAVPVAKLRAHLAETLPDYMVPAVFVWLDVLPLTPNGKLDRKALPVPNAPISAAVFEPPKSNTEQHIAAVWCEVLGRETVSIHDNFFDLGGHSLLIMRVHSLLMSAYPTLKIVDLFTYPRIRLLADALDQATGTPEQAQSRAGQTRGEQRRALERMRAQDRQSMRRPH
ncbi:hypothetical protein CCP3SC5AM1_1670001 [Gammaproteobacteria bacterium]